MKRLSIVERVCGLTGGVTALALSILHMPSLTGEVCKGRGNFCLYSGGPNPGVSILGYPMVFGIGFGLGLQIATYIQPKPRR